MDEISIRTYGNPLSSNTCALLNAAFLKAMALESRLPEWILDMEGMSGRKYRRLINNLVGAMPDARYLEIGSWAGSTACSAMSGNNAKITCIDNWSEFGGPKDKFEQNIAKTIGPGVDFNFIENDFRKVDFKDIGKYNIYLFDGPHHAEDQYDGIVLAQEALEHEYILIVDDWNAAVVAPETLRAMRKAQLHTLFSIEINTTQDNSHPPIWGAQSPWHNGYFLAVVRKNGI